MRATAKEFRIDEKQVREWCRQKPELMKMCAEGHGKRKRYSSGGMSDTFVQCTRRGYCTANTASAAVASACIAERH